MILPVRGATTAGSDVGVMSGMHDIGTWKVKIMLEIMILRLTKNEKESYTLKIALHTQHKVVYINIFPLKKSLRCFSKIFIIYYQLSILLSENEFSKMGFWLLWNFYSQGVETDEVKNVISQGLNCHKIGKYN